MKAGDLPHLLQYGDAGCELFQPFPMFVAIYDFTGGNPCNGCNYDLGGRCKARKALFPPATKPAPTAEPPVETVRAEAARLGVSISEVRRRRKAGNTHA